jgi:hypothetical protein
MKKLLSILMTFAILTLGVTLPLPAVAFTPNLQTAYARKFINLCDGQQWFIDEVERVLNMQEKTLDTIQSRADFEYSVCA